MYQIFSLKKNHIVLFEIFIIFLLLHLVYQLGYYGLRSGDSYVDFDFFKIILNNHKFRLGTDMMTGWPLIHIFSSTISMLTKIEPLSIAKIVPSFISSLIVLPLYLFVHSIYNNKRIALLSCLIFGSVPQFVNFTALFVRETFAIYFFVLFVFILYIAKKREEYRLKFLLLFLIPIIILSHHFTSFLLIIFLTIFMFFSKLIPYIYRKKYEQQKFSKINITTFYFIILTSLFIYWVYITTFIFNDFSSIFFEIIGEKEFISYSGKINLGAPIVTLQGNIIFYGFFLFNGIICLVLLMKFLAHKTKNIIEETSCTMFLYFCFFSGFLSLFFLGSIIYPDRFIPFGLLFGIIPLIVFLFSAKKPITKKILFLIIVAFLIFNIYNIDTKYYTGKASQDGEVCTEKEYAIAETINVPDIYYGYSGVSQAIYDVQRVDFMHGRKDPISITTDFFDISNIAIINEGMYLRYLEYTKIKSLITYDRLITVLSYKNLNDINKISDLGDIYILEWNTNYE